MEVKPPPYPGTEESPPPYSRVAPPMVTLQDGCPSTPPPPYPGTNPRLTHHHHAAVHQQPTQVQPTASAAQRHPTTVTVVTQTDAVFVGRFQESPVRSRCPMCHEIIETRLEYEAGTLAWFVCIVLFLFGVWPCCVLPLCVDYYKDVIHKCPNCDRKLGSFRRM